MQDVRTADWSEEVAPFWKAVIQSALSGAGFAGLLRAGWTTIKARSLLPFSEKGQKKVFSPSLSLTVNVLGQEARSCQQRAAKYRAVLSPTRSQSEISLNNPNPSKSSTATLGARCVGSACTEFWLRHIYIHVNASSLISLFCMSCTPASQLNLPLLFKRSLLPGCPLPLVVAAGCVGHAAHGSGLPDGPHQIQPDNSNQAAAMMSGQNRRTGMS